MNGHVIFAAILWWRGFCATDCHMQWNMAAPLITCKQTSNAWRKNAHHCPGSRNWKMCLLPAKWCRCHFGIFWGPFLEHYQNHGQMVNSAWYCAKFIEKLKPAIYRECRWQKSLLCIVTTLDFIQQQRSLKQLENWNWSFSLTQHRVQISFHLITILLDCPKRHYRNADLQTMKRYIHGFTSNWKHSSQINRPEFE